MVRRRSSAHAHRRRRRGYFQRWRSTIYVELRDELNSLAVTDSKPERYRGHSESLPAFGVDAFKRLNGMFAVRNS